MTRLCLFDPAHLVDEYGFDKHLRNCKSSMKKDWRQCKFDEKHWFLYKDIVFHQQYSCQSNPLFLKNSQAFYEKREQQIRRIEFQMKQKNKKKQNISKIDENQSILTLLKDQKSFSKFNQLQMSESKIKQNGLRVINNSLQMRQVSFGDISIIQPKNQTLISQRGYSKLLNSKIHKTNENISVYKNDNSININSNLNEIDSRPKQLKTGSKLWQQPDFCQFLMQFHKKLIDKRAKKLLQENNETNQKQLSQQMIKVEQCNQQKEYLNQISVDQLNFNSFMN